MLFARRLASATLEVTHIDVDSFFRRSGKGDFTFDIQRELLPQASKGRSTIAVLHTACTGQDRLVYYLFIFNRLQLNVVIKHKLMWMWAQPYRVHFFRALVVDIGGDQLLGERVALD